ncbi:hypothetical protein E2C01_074639 [Portunus trituberculatus]|uniref:Uncharacterized protein n=1 Tax=Portunus trituberculatus TaxID=210409 RepID=A0A5B7IHR8_PORTR|nr:hypothetical protein [Portunus trituberculatus]
MGRRGLAHRNKVLSPADDGSGIAQRRDSTPGDPPQASSVSASIPSTYSYQRSSRSHTTHRGSLAWVCWLVAAVRMGISATLRGSTDLPTHLIFYILLNFHKLEFVTT